MADPLWYTESSSTRAVPEYVNAGQVGSTSDHFLPRIVQDPLPHYD